MNLLDTEAQTSKQAEIGYARALKRNPTSSLLENPEGGPIERTTAMAAPHLPAPPPSKALEAARQQTLPPYVMEVEENCDECGGSAFDPGGVDPWGPEPCPACRGPKIQRITRNYLADAFIIAANPENTRTVERQHLVAVIQHCREAVSALVVLPEVALTQLKFSEARRLRHTRNNRHE